MIEKRASVLAGCSRALVNKYPESDGNLLRWLGLGMKIEPFMEYLGSLEEVEYVRGSSQNVGKIYENHKIKEPKPKRNLKYS